MPRRSVRASGALKDAMNWSKLLDAVESQATSESIADCSVHTICILVAHADRYHRVLIRTSRRCLSPSSSETLGRRRAIFPKTTFLRIFVPKDTF